MEGVRRTVQSSYFTRRVVTLQRPVLGWGVSLNGDLFNGGLLCYGDFHEVRDSCLLLYFSCLSDSAYIRQAW